MTEPLGLRAGARPSPTSATAIPISTLFAFLVGRREAIRKLASPPAMLGVGALLVLSAGLARNHDHTPFPHPRLLGPFGASLATSAVLFLVAVAAQWPPHT